MVGYRIDLPRERLRAKFTENSSYVIEQEKVGASETDMSGIVGEGHTLRLSEAQDTRRNNVIMNFSVFVMNRHFVDKDKNPEINLLPQIHKICSRWIDEGYLECPGGTGLWMLTAYPEISAQAAERIYNSILRASDGGGQVKAVLDPFNPLGSTRNVNFSTTKDVWRTDARKSHVNYVVYDSDWEATFARVAESHPNVMAYVKNQGLGFTVPYRDGNVAREYLPDFIVRIHDGGGVEDPLNLIVEIKGYKREQVKLKKDTTIEKWVPGVNSLGSYGRWRFVQFEDILEIKENFFAFVERLKENYRSKKEANNG